MMLRGNKAELSDRSQMTVQLPHWKQALVSNRPNFLTSDNTVGSLLNFCMITPQSALSFLEALFRQKGTTSRTAPILG
jgi:hypothetical protein